MILEMASGDLFSSPVRIEGVRRLVVRDGRGTPVAVFQQVADDLMTHVAAGDPKFPAEVLALGLGERVDVVRASL
jgi:hypothetical protein